ncbi:MAG: MaoC family dehydratase N-terminal domain-containing protein [Frankiaceae bacterium]|jgi:acyl dehydratase|nr:MaoC family dehydratase N-terminal domain-containing protein [Frankiaceae bacterium]
MSGVRAAESVSVGDRLEPREVRLTRADLIRYAGASGDFNVIHWDERAARAAGLPGVIAHGMLTMGQALQAVVDWAGDPGRVLDYGVRFTRPVVVEYEDGATLSIAGTVIAVDPATRRATVELSVAVAGAAVLSRARATVQLD